VAGSPGRSRLRRRRQSAARLRHEHGRHAAGAALKTRKVSASQTLVSDVVAASRVLAQQGVLDAYGHVSARSDKRPERFIMSRSRAPALVTAADIMEHDADSEV